LYPPKQGKVEKETHLILTQLLTSTSSTSPLGTTSSVVIFIVHHSRPYLPLPLIKEAESNVENHEYEEEDGHRDCASFIICIAVGVVDIVKIMVVIDIAIAVDVMATFGIDSAVRKG
jgi:hypothetical protein